MQLGENAMAARKAINQAANPLCAWNHRAHRIFGARKAFFPTMISSIRSYVMASNSSPPLIKAANTRHGTNIKHSSTSNPIPTPFATQTTPNHTHTHYTAIMSGSNVGNAAVYEANEQRTVSDATLEEEKKENRFHEGKENSHQATDSSTLPPCYHYCSHLPPVA
jgi:hypothetical protein